MCIRDRCDTGLTAGLLPESGHLVALIHGNDITVLCDLTYMSNCLFILFCSDPSKNKPGKGADNDQLTVSYHVQGRFLLN